jgi:hydroxyethylthiazole kinase-like uncharacterized protein yjeF
VPEPLSPGIPVPTGTESAHFDLRAFADYGIPSAVLMESAGRGAADLVQALVPEGPVVVLAGAGNNGGDAVVLARTLHLRGRDVRLLVDPRRPHPDPLLHGHDVPLAEVSTESIRAAEPAALWVDGLLGTGLSGPPRAPMSDWIEALNRRGHQPAVGWGILSLDTPSGIDADTGAVSGVAVQARATVAFGAPKLGCLFHPARAHVGRLFALEIGFPPWRDTDVQCRLITGSWVQGCLPRRPLRTHKNAVGRMLLLAGGPEMGGAALLSARGALRAGVGMLRVLTDGEHRGLLYEGVAEAVLPELPLKSKTLEELVAGVDTVVAGPGMGLDLSSSRSLASHLSRALEIAAGLGAEGPGWVLDADALTLLASGAFPLTPDPALVPILLTPHAGEMARLLPNAHRADSPFETARACASRWGGTVVFKGTPSVVVSPDGAPDLVSASGSSAFARAGMGDVLAGVAGAFMARGAPPRDAAALALHLTGRASELAMEGVGGGEDADHATGRRRDWAPYPGGPPDTLLPTDLIEALPRARRELDGPLSLASGLPPSVTLDLPAPR